MDTILQIIQTIGFPIACCLFLGLFVKKQNDEYREDVRSITDKYELAIEKFSNSLDQNTRVLTSLEAKLDKGE